jgi:Biopolymer transport protein
MKKVEINLTPMLDVVFIMLIFFIVTANFIKEPGLEVNRPDSDTSEIQENAAILIAIVAMMRL